MLTWTNSHGVAKVLDYILIFSSLVNTVIDSSVTNVVNYFDTDHKAVAVFVGFGDLLDVQLFLFQKQANKNHWKFDVKNANIAKWCKFKNTMAANVIMFSDEFARAVTFLDLDAIWAVVHKIIVFSADGTFKKKWFKGFDDVFTKKSSKFHKLKLLVSKLVKASYSASSKDFASLLET
ncbi:hypothetical protein G9A89_011361 [Geosiphon pyriformis]|nr:hypothetical protein G9A89_011361 [Geosiphon pyriformis]